MKIRVGIINQWKQFTEKYLFIFRLIDIEVKNDDWMVCFQFIVLGFGIFICFDKEQSIK